MATLILSGRDVRALLPMSACIAAVESAFRELANGRTAPPATLSMHTETGAFHTKAGTLRLADGHYFAVKTNGNFPSNPSRRGLPTIQGVVLLCDAEDGRVLAIMDSVELTARRTAAATAIAARQLARPGPAAVMIWGCGVQALAQLAALRTVLEVRRVLVYDVDAERARTFAAAAGAEAADDPHDAARRSDVIVTCTTSQEFLLFPEHVRAGTFVAAVGVDNESKQEIAPALMARSKVITDVTAQCAQIGDLHHAIDAGAMRAGDVHAELPAIVAGFKTGRSSAEEIIVFDSTGIGLQDVAAAAVVYSAAISARDKNWPSIELT